jgi:hypothetical protein
VIVAREGVTWLPGSLNTDAGDTSLDDNLEKVQPILQF